MARIETDPNYTAPTFSRATAGTDIFKKEDVQGVAAALSTHTHGAGKGVALEAAAIPNGLITSAMIADGTVDTVDLKDGSVTNAKLGAGSVSSDKLAAGAVTSTNLFVNPSFDVWQKGNGPFTTNGLIHADRWNMNMVGGDTFSVSRDTANRDTVLGGTACAVVNFVVSGGAGTSTIRQPIAFTEIQFGGTASFSIRVKTSTPNAVRIWFHNGAAATQGTFHTGGGAWETLSMTVTPGTAGGTGYNYFGVSFAASCVAYLDNAMLAASSTPSSFVPLHPQEDLDRCERYYQSLDWGISRIIGTSIASGTTGIPGMALPIARKAATPSTTGYGGWSAQFGNGAATGVTVTWIANNAAIVLFTGTATGLTNGNAYQVYSGGGGAGVLLESNP